MIIAVTGGSGFVGGEVVRQALDRGDDVRILTRRNIPSKPNLSVTRGDIITGHGLAEAFLGVDVVIHAAGLAHQHSGIDSSRFFSVNANGAATVVRAAAAAGVPRVVLLSSVSVYGGTIAPTVADEHCTPKPTSPYGESKLAGEVQAISEADTSSVALRLLRLATVFGAGDPGNVVRLIRAIQCRRFIHIGSTTTRKSLVHNSDVGRACLAAADDATHTKRCLNVVGGIYPVGEITSTISAILGIPLRKLRIPSIAADATGSILRAMPGFASRAGNSIQRWRSDEAYSGNSLEQLYGLRAQVGLRTGLAEEIAWYLSSQSRTK